MKLLLMQFSLFSSILHMLTHKIHATLQDIIMRVTLSENCLIGKCPNINCCTATSILMAVTESFTACFFTLYNTEKSYVSANTARGGDQLRIVAFWISSSFLLNAVSGLHDSLQQLLSFAIFADRPSFMCPPHPTNSKGMWDMVTMQARLVDKNDQSNN